MEEALTIKKQLKISIPMAFENLVNIFMTLIDTLVIASLGSNDILTNCYPNYEEKSKEKKN